MEIIALKLGISSLMITCNLLYTTVVVVLTFLIEHRCHFINFSYYNFNNCLYTFRLVYSRPNKEGTLFRTLCELINIYFELSYRIKHIKAEAHMQSMLQTVLK